MKHLHYVLFTLFVFVCIGCRENTTEPTETFFLVNDRGTPPVLLGSGDAENLLDKTPPHQLNDTGTPIAWQARDEHVTFSRKQVELPHGSAEALVVDIKAPVAGDGFVSQTITPVEPNTRYALTGWVRSSKPGVGYLQLKTHKTIEGKPRESNRYSSSTSDATWQRLQRKVMVDNADSLVVLCRWLADKNTVGATVEFADVQLVKDPLPTSDATAANTHGDLLPNIIATLDPERDRKRIDTDTVDGQTVLRIESPGETAPGILVHKLKLNPHKFYRLTVEARGPGQLGFAWKVPTPQTDKLGDNWEGMPVGFLTNPSDKWETYTTVAPPAPQGAAELVIDARRYTVRGRCQVRRVVVQVIDQPKASRPVEPAAEGWTRITRLPVAGGRVLRGEVYMPFDGTTHSWHYRDSTYEFGDGNHNQSVYYNYKHSDALHLDLGEHEGFDYVTMQGGAYTRMFDGATYDTPGGRLLWEFTKTPVSKTPRGAWRPTDRVFHDEAQHARFAQPVKTRRISFFNTSGGVVAEVGFNRLETIDRPVGKLVRYSLADKQAELPEAESIFDVQSIRGTLEKRHPSRRGVVLSMVPGELDEVVRLKANRPTHFVAEPATAEMGLSKIALEMNVSAKQWPVNLSVTVNDPLNPRRHVHYAGLRLARPGPVRLVMDFPDQVVLKGRRVWITLNAERDCTLGGPDDGAPMVGLGTVSVDEARPAAVAWRKTLMLALYMRISEPRSWMKYKQGRSRRDVYEFYQKRGHGGEMLAELFDTIDSAHALAPDDDTVRQVRQWCLGGTIDIGTAPPVPAPPAGVPAWAHYNKLALDYSVGLCRKWMNRLVETGEFGGRINDDSCLYQQMVDFPMVQDDDFVPELKRRARAFLALAESKSLEGGINRRTMDPLHGYEEGVNHQNLVARWHYGDPVYLEKLMVSARNVERLTWMTDKGHRRFHRYKQGWPTAMRKPPLGTVGDAESMLWHTSLQLAQYNRNPRALRNVKQWADGWMSMMEYGKYPTHIDAATGKVLRTSSTFGSGMHGLAPICMWLADLTRDATYVEPVLARLRKGDISREVATCAPDIARTGLLKDVPKEALEKATAELPELKLVLGGDPSAYIEAYILGTPTATGRYVATLYHASRWPNMTDPDRQYTDRAWFTLQNRVSVTYLGGTTYRNKMNPTQAVAWGGLGRDYAAVVTRNRHDGLRASLFNFHDSQRSGHMTVLRLEHGRYRVTMGPDADGDHRMDRATSTRELELARADEVPFELPPRQATVIEVTQLEKLEAITDRADPALSSQTTYVEGNFVKGTLHNVGAKAATDVVVALVDGQRELARIVVPTIAAPLDLEPKHVSFELPLPGPVQPGWRVVVDPANAIPEIYEGNNTVVLE